MLHAIRISAVFMLVSSSLTGCGNYVSQRESLDTALGANGRMHSTNQPEIYGYVPAHEDRAVDMTPAPAETKRSPRVVVLDPPENQPLEEGWYWQSTGPEPARVYVGNVNMELDALHRDMALLRARADRKGAAAQAALEPAMRDLNAHEDLIQDRMLQLEQDDSDQRAILEEQIDQLLQDAQRSVRQASAEIDRLPTNQ